MRRRSHQAVAIAVVGGAAAVLACGCGLILGVSDWRDVACADDCGGEATVFDDAGGDAPGDALQDEPRDAYDAMPDGPDASSAADAGDAGDANDAGDAAEAGPYHALSSIANWLVFDVATINGAASGFAGGAFDGRYVYFTPHFNGTYDGVVARYDTTAQGGFTSSGSWSTFDTKSVASGAGGFLGAVYDSAHATLYLVPSYDGAPDGLVATYGTLGAFSQTTSWNTFGMSSLQANAKGFAGGTFDGRYVYFVPASNGSPDGVVARYDTTQSLQTPAAWAFFDTTSVTAGAKGFYGALLAAKHVLLVPNNGGSPSGVVASYDTTAAFASAASWRTYDLAGIAQGARGFHGGVFDGQYVYLVPYSNGSLDGLVARFAASSAVDDQSAWTLFDTTTVDARAAGFGGGAFDGRYVYLVPAAGTVLARYDTAAAFDGASAWETFDLAQVGQVGPFLGAVFDGEYVYFVPSTSGVAARFDARNPPAMPPGQSGSFL